MASPPKSQSIAYGVPPSSVSQAEPIVTLRAQLEQYYTRVLGVLYQVLGDAELAAQAAEAVFLGDVPFPDQVALWSATMRVIKRYLARGFVVRPIVALADDRQAEIMRGLAQLDPLDRALLLLHYHEELSTDALARVLELDEATVRARLATARTHLLDRLC